jgi:membrane protein YqaA with SNARE-associated domain
VGKSFEIAQNYAPSSFQPTVLMQINPSTAWASIFVWVCPITPHTYADADSELPAASLSMDSGFGAPIPAHGRDCRIVDNSIDDNSISSILCGAVLLRNDRWKQIVLISSLGSATGGLILYSVFYYLGWSQIVAAYPDLIHSTVWSDATQWVSAYGAVALLGIAAMPLPQTPALIFTVLVPLPAWQVFLALLLGKLLKYGFYGWLAAKFPSWVQRLAYLNAAPPENPRTMARFQEGKSASSMTRLSACDDQSSIPSKSQKRL